MTERDTPDETDCSHSLLPSPTLLDRFRFLKISEGESSQKCLATSD